MKFTRSLAAAGVQGQTALRRSFPVLLSYLFNAAILIGCIAVLGELVSSQSLQSFLVYFFVCGIAAGLEPGTAKGALKHSGVGSELDGGASLMLASTAKALLISPALLVIWAYSDAKVVGVKELAWCPIIAILGFLATDLRVALDAQGRHAAAIWAKQGSLGLAAVVVAACLAFGLQLAHGIAFACLMRAGWVVVFWLLAKKPADTCASVGDHLFKRPWRHLLLASCLGALSASIDRIVAFRLLDPATANAYFLAYEILTKFWLFNYLLAPVVFVATIEAGLGGKLAKYAYLIITAAGVPFLLFTLIVTLLPFSAFAQVKIEPWALFIFGVAILIAAWNGVLAAELQASHFARVATISAGAGLAISIIAFPSALLLWGVNGLFVAWTLKSAVEFGVLFTVRTRAHNK